MHTLAGASNMARARFERGSDSDSDPWLDRPILADPREFPLLAAHSAELAALLDRDLFTAGVELVIESAERAATQR